jgi:hypothetical protein
MEPHFFPDNYPVWNVFFRLRYKRELAAYDAPLLPRATMPPATAAGHCRWWSAQGRTLENVLAHIEGGNYPVLGMLLPPSLSHRRGSSWIPDAGRITTQLVTPRGRYDEHSSKFSLSKNVVVSSTDLP